MYIWFTVCHVWLFVDPGPNIPHWTIDRFTVTLSSKRPLTYIWHSPCWPHWHVVFPDRGTHTVASYQVSLFFFYLQVLSQRTLCLNHLKKEVAMQHGEGRGGRNPPLLLRMLLIKNCPFRYQYLYGKLAPKGNVCVKWNSVRYFFANESGFIHWKN